MENPAMEDSLVRLAATIAREPWGQLHLTHVVTPDDPPIADIQRALDRAVALAVDMGVGASAHLVHGENVTIAIQQALQTLRCEVLMMGWYGDVDPATVLSSQNRALAKALNVDTLIFKDKGFGGIRRLLVPTGGGIHSMMGLEVAHQLAQAWQAQMRAIRIARVENCRNDDPIQQRYYQQVSDDLRMQLRLLDIDVEHEVIPAQEVVAPVIDTAHDDDLLVLGASNDWRQEDFLAGSIPDEIAYKAPCSVLMVRSRNLGNHRLSNIFWEHTIRLDLHPRDKWEAINQMVNVLVDERQVPPSQRDIVLAAACEREHKSSTAIGRETAIPHAPLPNLPGIIGALGICPEGVDFDGLNGDVVRYIFLLLTPQQNYRTYIPILAQIASLMHTAETRSAILHCETPSELTALIKNQERDPAT